MKVNKLTGRGRVRVVWPDVTSWQLSGWRLVETHPTYAVMER